MSKRLIRLLGCLVVALTTPPVFAQEYPTKAITLIVPFAAGGSTDTIARLLAQAMGAYLKQPVIVENVAGAGGTIAATRAARAAPDGYTLLIHHIGHSTAPALYKKLSYDPIKDFEPVGLVTDAPMMLVARKDLPAKDLKELIAYVKANKDKVTFASAGPGAVSHLCGMLFMKAVETPLTSVPYKGSGPVMNDLLGGQVDLTCDQTTNTTGPIRADKIQVYCATSKTRVPSLPDVPTCDEAGLPNFEVGAWHGLYAPKGTPKPVIDKLVVALQVALKDATVNQRLADLGTEPMAEAQATPEPLRRQLKSEVDRWEPLIKEAGVYAE